MIDILMIFIAMSAGCQDGDIRLVGGVEPREGQVEVCYNGIWGRVCSQGWSYSNAAVVCRQLGYSTKGKKEGGERRGEEEEEGEEERGRIGVYPVSFSPPSVLPRSPSHHKQIL